MGTAKGAAAAEPLSLERRGAVAVVSFERPETRNALDARAWRALGTALDRVDAEPDCRALVLRGTGGAFASGADLGELAALVADPPRLAEWYAFLRATLERLHGFARPTVAAIDGHCHGAGLSLALACDLRLATSRSTLSAPPARLGLQYSVPELRRLVARVGPGRARELLYTARAVDGTTAERIGLVERCVDAERFESALDEWLGPLAALSPQSIRGHKRALVAIERGGVADDRAAEAAFFGADAAEGLAAFAERRPPDYAARRAGDTDTPRIP